MNSSIFLYVSRSTQSNYCYLEYFPKNLLYVTNISLVKYICYFAETPSVHLQQSFYTNNREELSFSRMEYTWDYEAAKNIYIIIGFRSTHDLKAIGEFCFVDAAHEPSELRWHHLRIRSVHRKSIRLSEVFPKKLRNILREN